MYKFLSKTWSYFMGIKDMFLIMIAILGVLGFIGGVYINTEDGEETRKKIFGIKEKPSYKDIKKRPKMGFSIESEN